MVRLLTDHSTCRQSSQYFFLRSYRSPNPITILRLSWHSWAGHTQQTQTYPIQGYGKAKAINTGKSRTGTELAGYVQHQILAATFTPNATCSFSSISILAASVHARALSIPHWSATNNSSFLETTNHPPRPPHQLRSPYHQTPFNNVNNINVPQRSTLPNTAGKGSHLRPFAPRTPSTLGRRSVG